LFFSSFTFSFNNRKKPLKNKAKIENPKKFEKFLELKRDSSIPPFNFPQFEYELFWSYLQRLNDYHAQSIHNFKKWGICEVLAMGLDSASRCYVKSICPRGLTESLSKTQDEACDFFKKLASDAYEFDQAKQNFGYPTHGKSIFPFCPYPQDHFLDSYAPSYSCVSPALCDYCESSAHDTCNCPYCDLMLMLNVQVWKRR